MRYCDQHIHSAASFDATASMGEMARAARESVALCDRYPDPKCRTLTRAAAYRDGVPEGWILWGNGASDLIQRTVLIRHRLIQTISQYYSFRLLVIQFGQQILHQFP